MFHGLGFHLSNCLNTYSDDNDGPDCVLPSILSNVTSEFRKGTDPFFKNLSASTKNKFMK